MIVANLSLYSILEIANDAIRLANEAAPEKTPTQFFEVKEYIRDITGTGRDAVDYICRVKMPNGRIIQQIHSITGDSQVFGEEIIKANLLAHCLATALYEFSTPA